MNNREHNRLLTRLALLAGLCTAAPLFSGVVAAAEPVRSVTVGYGDLNLESHAGIDTLYSRLQSAARQVCPTDSSTPLAAKLAYRACRQEALSNSIAKAGIPALVDMHDSQTGSSQPTRVAANGSLVPKPAR